MATYVDGNKFCINFYVYFSFGPTIIVIILNWIPNIHVFYKSVAVNL